MKETKTKDENARRIYQLTAAGANQGMLRRMSSAAGTPSTKPSSVSAPVGYIFGYATLADSSDPLVTRVRGEYKPVWGLLTGYRRRWKAAMENLDGLNDHKHYLDPVTGARPDICPVALSVESGEGQVNGVALPVREQDIEFFDRRELHYDRIEVSSAFSVSLDRPVWTYTANAVAAKQYREALASGRAFICRSYFHRVHETFRTLGPGPWESFRASTDQPECPLLDLEHSRIGIEPGE